jgi:DNA gyrase subunit A
VATLNTGAIIGRPENEVLMRSGVKNELRAEVDEVDEVLVVLASGKVIRTNASEVPAKGRDTMGVVFARFEESDSVLSLARNTERNLETNDLVDVEGESDGEAVQAE